MVIEGSVINNSTSLTPFSFQRKDCKWYLGVGGLGMCGTDVQIICCHRYHVPWDCTNTENKDSAHIGKNGKNMFPTFKKSTKKYFLHRKKTPQIFNGAKDCVHMLAHHLAKRVCYSWGFPPKPAEHSLKRKFQNMDLFAHKDGRTWTPKLFPALQCLN